MGHPAEVEAFWTAVVASVEMTAVECIEGWYDLWLEGGVVGVAFGAG
jgi:hypothetical protein